MSSAARRVGAALAFGVLPVVLMFSILAVTYGHKTFLFDFKGDLYGAGQSIVHGQNPYNPGFLTTQAAIQRAGGTPKTIFALPVYAAPALVASVPFSLLPYPVAAVLFAALLIGALALGLRLLGVRDWRCYGVSCTCWPFLLGLRLGGLTPLIVLGAAIAWRWRERLWPPAIAIASIIVAKLFPWPLAVWLLVTKRLRALALTLVIGGVGTIAAWAAIGFAGMAEYPRMLSNLAFVEQGHGPSLVALLLATGVPTGVAKVVALAAAAALLSAAWRFVGRPDGEQRAFGLIVMAALTASPLVWQHYLVLVFVPIALMSPTLSAIWFVPMLAYLAPGAQTQGNVLEILPYLAIEAVVIGQLCGVGELMSRLRRISTAQISPPVQSSPASGP
ncbi:MAG: glycosyltransferase 87 family protein [Actinomycetota bacterium]|nr:glycosyltransferase 87 family protein [Actinomycetota bacterium]